MRQYLEPTGGQYKAVFYAGPLDNEVRYFPSPPPPLTMNFPQGPAEKNLNEYDLWVRPSHIKYHMYRLSSYHLGTARYHYVGLE